MNIDLGAAIFLSSLVVTFGLVSVAAAINRLADKMSDVNKQREMAQRVGSIVTILAQIRDGLKGVKNERT